MLSNDLLLIFFAHSFKSTIHVSLHILIISLNMWYSVQYVCSSFIVRCIFSPSVLFFRISSTGLLSIIIKAYSLGTSTCHTTNILIRWFYCVHWIKPPFHKFPINDISPTYEIFFILDKLFFYHLRYKLEFIISSLLRLWSISPWYHSIIVIHPFSFSTIYFTIFDIRCLTRYFISISCIFRFLNELRIYNKNTSYKICDIQFSRFPFSSGILFCLFWISFGLII